MARKQKRKPVWPKGLSQPLSIEKRRTPFIGSPEDFDRKDFNQRLRLEVRSRIETIAKFLQCKTPSDLNDEWVILLMKICEHWSIPAFSPSFKKSGAPKEWTDHKYCELYADVQSLIVSGGLSDKSACEHIVKNPKKFGGRYPAANAEDQVKKRTATLRRQYAEAKKKTEADSLFRLLYLAIGDGFLNRTVPKDELALARIAIERFAFERN